MAQEKEAGRQGVVENSVIRCDRCGKPGDPLTDCYRLIQGQRVRMCCKCARAFDLLHAEGHRPGGYALVTYKRGQLLSGYKSRAQIDHEIDLAVRKANQAVDDAIREAVNRLEELMKSYEPRDRS